MPSPKISEVSFGSKTAIPPTFVAHGALPEAVSPHPFAVAHFTFLLLLSSDRKSDAAQDNLSERRVGARHAAQSYVTCMPLGDCATSVNLPFRNQIETKTTPWQFFVSDKIEGGPPPPAQHFPNPTLCDCLVRQSSRIKANDSVLDPRGGNALPSDCRSRSQRCRRASRKGLSEAVKRPLVKTA
jgi:hypothetical protein